MTAERKASAWRLAALALFCGVPLLLLVLVVTNSIATSDAQGTAARQEATLEAITRKLAGHKTRTLTEAEASSLFLEATSNSLARAEIQERTAKLVQDAGGRLVEAQLTGTPEQEAEGTVAIQLTLDIGNKGLLDLLYAAETSIPLITVYDLSVRTNNGQNDERPAESGTLRIEMTLQGHWKKSTG